MQYLKKPIKIKSKSHLKSLLSRRSNGDTFLSIMIPNHICRSYQSRVKNNCGGLGGSSKHNIKSVRAVLDH